MYSGSLPGLEIVTTIACSIFVGKESGAVAMLKTEVSGEEKAKENFL